jgi:hypothetical protein
MNLTEIDHIMLVEYGEVCMNKQQVSVMKLKIGTRSLEDLCDLAKEFVMSARAHCSCGATLTHYQYRGSYSLSKTSLRAHLPLSW